MGDDVLMPICDVDTALFSTGDARGAVASDDAVGIPGVYTPVNI
jgi:hypothetical protein